MVWNLMHRIDHISEIDKLTTFSIFFLGVYLSVIIISHMELAEGDLGVQRCFGVVYHELTTLRQRPAKAALAK